MVLAYVDGSVVDERVDACFDNVLVHVFEGAVSFQFADSPVVHAFAGIADETADGLADAVSEAEQAFARVDEPDYRRVDYLGVLDASLPVLLFRGMACLDGRVAVLHVRAVSAVVAVFLVVGVAEIVEDDAAKALVGFAVAAHGVETVERGLLGLGAALRVFERVSRVVGEAAPPVGEVAAGPQHDASCWFAVSSRASRFLVERFQAFAGAVVDDPAYVGLVDAHAERGGRADHAWRAG